GVRRSCEERLKGWESNRPQNKRTGAPGLGRAKIPFDNVLDAVTGKNWNYPTPGTLEFRTENRTSRLRHRRLRTASPICWASRRSGTATFSWFLRLREELLL